MNNADSVVLMPKMTSSELESILQVMPKFASAAKFDVYNLITDDRLVKGMGEAVHGALGGYIPLAIISPVTFEISYPTTSRLLSIYREEEMADVVQDLSILNSPLVRLSSIEWRLEGNSSVKVTPIEVTVSYSLEPIYEEYVNRLRKAMYEMKIPLVITQNPRS